METNMCVMDAVDHINNLKDWMKPEKVLVVLNISGLLMIDRLKEKILKPRKGALSSHSVWYVCVRL